MRRALPTLAVVAGLLASSGLQRPPQLAGDAPRVLFLSDQARRFLALEYRSFPIESMGCMIGDVRGRVVVVRRIAPADVNPSQSTATWVVPRQTCESAGWSGTVGTIHSHPGAERCWYFFPGTEVPSSDGGFIGRFVVPPLQNAGHTVAIFHRGTRVADVPPGAQSVRGDRHNLAAIGAL